MSFRSPPGSDTTHPLECYKATGLPCFLEANRAPGLTLVSVILRAFSFAVLLLRFQFALDLSVTFVLNKDILLLSILITRLYLSGVIVHLHHPDIDIIPNFSVKHRISFRIIGAFYWDRKFRIILCMCIHLQILAALLCVNSI